ncbi:hypothetical protein H4I96_00646 [Botrytis cinerea]
MASSLWGSKKDNEHLSASGSVRSHSHSQNGDSNEPVASHQVHSQPHYSHEADEHTRLLPPSRDGYLSPDDPAVSPYNLWSVRFLRYFTVLFAIITFLWWVLLLVSIFVSPPGMHSRGSGFFDFSYTTLTLGLLLIVLLFFSTPSKAAQVTCLVIAVILLVDMIMIVAVPRLRVEEGWVGIASVVWALLIAIWTIVTDRVVAAGKIEEEERLTGRAETRRTLREWCSVLISTIILVIFGNCYRERYYVDGDKYQIHVFCEGNVTDAKGKKNPTILFEAGEGPFEHGMLQIATNAFANGSISRYCYSDRPGIAWSDNAPSPFSAGMAADALSEALARAGEEGPWILASAGVGSIYSRIFSSRHAREIAGLLLIDPLHEDLLYRLGTPQRGFVLWVVGRTREDRVFGRSAYQGGKFLKAKLQESLVANSLTKNEVSSARNIQYASTPLVLISSGIEVRRNDEWKRKQEDLSHLTDNLKSWDVVKGAPSEVWKTLEGREIIEKRLKKLVKGAADFEIMAELN